MNEDQRDQMVEWREGWQLRCSRNVELSVHKVAYSFLEAGDMQGDITTRRELLGQSFERKHDRT